MLKPAEGAGISPEKKVRRKVRASPFNKKSGVCVGRTEFTWKMILEVNRCQLLHLKNVDVIDLPARARTQRANR
ncbi:hypothetical protein NC651_021553 [Populus alba x Populus x berolinensis]|nr:hypothetical protein NC651_021553 [Populus alba x Populus x berolinensis]